MEQVILSDENCGGHAVAIFHALKRLGYVELLDLSLKMLSDFGLKPNTDDETVWRFC